MRKFIVRLIVTVNLVATSFFLVKYLNQTSDTQEAARQQSNAKKELSSAKKGISDKEKEAVVRETEFSDAANKFMKIAFSFESSEEYHDIKNKLQKSGLVTDEVLDNDLNTFLFADGKDKDGGDYIENSGLKQFFKSSSSYVESVDGDKVTGIVVVNAESSFANRTPGKTTTLLRMTYDLKQGKFVSGENMGRAFLNSDSDLV